MMFQQPPKIEMSLHLLMLYGNLFKKYGPQKLKPCSVLLQCGTDGVLRRKYLLILNADTLLEVVLGNIDNAFEDCKGYFVVDTMRNGQKGEFFRYDDTQPTIQFFVLLIHLTILCREV